MAWKTKKQRKISKFKSRVKKIACFSVLILCVVYFSGIFHGESSEKETPDVESSSMCILKQSDLEDTNSNDHCFRITIDDHIFELQI